MVTKVARKSFGKRLKFKNVKCEEDGLRFDSQRERERYRQLRILRDTGRITDLKVHPSFTLKFNDVLICRYVGDFSYHNEEGIFILEDVKSPVTSKLPVFRLKKKLMLAVLGIDVQEVFMD